MRVMTVRPDPDGVRADTRALWQQARCLARSPGPPVPGAAGVPERLWARADLLWSLGMGVAIGGMLFWVGLLGLAVSTRHCGWIIAGFPLGAGFVLVAIAFGIACVRVQAQARHAMGERKRRWLLQRQHEERRALYATWN